MVLYNGENADAMPIVKRARLSFLSAMNQECLSGLSLNTYLRYLSSNSFRRDKNSTPRRLLQMSRTVKKEKAAAQLVGFLVALCDLLQLVRRQVS